MEALKRISGNVTIDDKYFYALLDWFRNHPSKYQYSIDENSLVSLEKYFTFCKSIPENKAVLLEILSKCADLDSLLFSDSQRKRFLLLSMKSAILLDNSGNFLLDSVIPILNQNLVSRYPSLHSDIFMFVCQLSCYLKRIELLSTFGSWEQISDMNMLGGYIYAYICCNQANKIPLEIRNKLSHQLELLSNTTTELTIKKKNDFSKQPKKPSNKSTKKKLKRKERYLEKIRQKNGGILPTERTTSVSSNQWLPKPKKRKNKKKNFQSKSNK